MVYGPCGGVRPDSGCEIDAARPCPFVTAPLRRWPGAAVAGPPGTLAGPGPGRPWVITDLHVTPRHLGALGDVAGRLRGSCDAVLVGDHGGARNDFAPSFMAATLIRLGITPWVTLSCRDRNRVALGAELAALAELGVAGVHCVTGDWEGVAGSGGETKVFDLDCLRLVEAARNAGLTVSVAATPAAPPPRMRPARLAEKVRAGAQLCFVNHCGGPQPVARFVAAAREAGARIPFVPCLAVAADTSALARLARLPGTELDEGAAGDATGVDDAVGRAVRAAVDMLRIEGVEGVNLSGSASSVSDQASAAIMAAVGARVRCRADPDQPPEPEA